MIQSTTMGLKQQIQDVSGKKIVISRKFQQSGGFRPIKQKKHSWMLDILHTRDFILCGNLSWSIKHHKTI